MRLGRLYYITKTLLQFGLDDLLPRSRVPWYAKLLRGCFFWLRNCHADKPPAQRIRLALQQLGPVWIKFGQMLSTRRDLLPPDIADELALLQDQVQPFEGAEAQKLIEEALGLDDIHQLFDDFDLTPLASASVAQVHTGLRAQIGQRSVWQTRGGSITLFRPRFRCFLIQNASMGVGKRI